MTIVSTGGLFDCLREHRLLPTDQLDALTHLAPGRFGDAKVMSKVLLQRRWLTVYQINEILDGNAKQLVFGPYRLLDPLGQGGLSQVYHASHAETQQKVALKVIRPEVITSWRGRHQFLLEMEAMTRLDHPNIVEFCDADISDETCYFAMEYVQGTDLGKYAKLNGPLTVLEACEYARQISLGLQHAHERNLVHRDIKPVNLFLTRDADDVFCRNPGRIKIIDWGLSCTSQPHGRINLTRAPQGILGSADYLSPEQARQADSVDIRSDLYSLGCTLYYLLVGQPPFPHGTPMQKILYHQQVDPTPIESLRSDLPQGLTGLLPRLLAKRPEDRFQTPAALSLALQPFCKEVNASKPIMTKPPPPNRPGDRRDDTPMPIFIGKEMREQIALATKARKTKDEMQALQQHA